MRLNLLLSLLTLFASCFAVAAETASTVKDSLVIGCYDAAPPFGYKVAGELTGFDIDIIQMAVSEMGITNIEFVPVTSATRFTVLRRTKSTWSLPPAQSPVAVNASSIFRFPILKTARASGSPINND